jgi:hypothetical protein
MDTESRVVLTEIKGDLKLIRQSQDQYTKDMDRMTRGHADFERHTNDRLTAHSSRLTILETARSHADGIKTGTERTLRLAHLVWASATSAGVVAVGAAVLRSLHV